MSSGGSPVSLCFILVQKKKSQQQGASGGIKDFLFLAGSSVFLGLAAGNFAMEEQSAEIIARNIVDGDLDSM